MDYRKITAIVRAERLESIEQALQTHGIRGVSITRVKGYGELINLNRDDWLEGHARIEIFTAKEHTDAIVQLIMDAGSVGMAGDGIIAVLPVEQLYKIRTKQPAGTEEI